MGNNEIAILINKIKLDKELMILDINFIAFKELAELRNKVYNLENLITNNYKNDKTKNTKK